MLNNKPGQTLVELIVAIAVIEIGLFSVWSLFLVNFNAEREAEYRIVGVNLAREGIEAVKNIRDSNWLKRNYNVESKDGQLWTWDQGLSAGIYSVNFDSLELASEEFFQLYFDNNGFYSNIVSNLKTGYSREVVLKDICCADNDKDYKCDDLKYVINKEGCGSDLKIGINVISEVKWQIQGKDRKAVLESNLYDWQ